MKKSPWSPDSDPNGWDCRTISNGFFCSKLFPPVIRATCDEIGLRLSSVLSSRVLPTYPSRFLSKTVYCDGTHDISVNINSFPITPRSRTWFPVQNKITHNISGIQPEAAEFRFSSTSARSYIYILGPCPSRGALVSGVVTLSPYPLLTWNFLVVMVTLVAMTTY